MTDNEIIKALDSVGTSTGIALGHHSGQADIIADRFRELIDENNRQKAEIERLNIECQSMRNAANSYKMYYEAIKEFADRLCDGRVSNDPVVIAVKVELEMTEAQKQIRERKMRNNESIYNRNR